MTRFGAIIDAEQKYPPEFLSFPTADQGMFLVGLGVSTVLFVLDTYCAPYAAVVVNGIEIWLEPLPNSALVTDPGSTLGSGSGLSCAGSGSGGIPRVIGHS